MKRQPSKPTATRSTAAKSGSNATKNATKSAGASARSKRKPVPAGKTAKAHKKPAAGQAPAPSRRVAKVQALSPVPAACASPEPATSPATSPTTSSVRSASKQSQLIALLGSASGASMAQMTGLTGWQPHTVRGMLSGCLRKRLGLKVQHQVEDGVRVYRLVEAAEQ